MELYVANPIPGDEPYAKSAQTRRTILLAAAKLFKEEGYDATTVRRIADTAGLEAGSIYYHFKSKYQILNEVLDIGVRQLYNEVKIIAEAFENNNVSFRENFTRLVDIHLNFLLTRNDFTSANIRNYPILTEKRRMHHRPLREAYAKLWRSFLQRAQDAGELREDISVILVSQFILGAMNWTTEWYDTTRYPVSVLSERLSKLLLDGMSSKDLPVIDVAVEPFGILPDDPEEGGKAERTRQAILNAAARILRESGHNAATIRRVAKEAGLEAGSVYYHFGSKAEILDEILDVGLRDLLRGVRRAIASWPDKEDQRNRIAIAITVHLAYLFRASAFTSANVRNYGMLSKEIRSRHRPMRHEYAKVWDQTLRAAQKAGSLRSDIQVVPLRQFLLGALNWTIEWFDPAKGRQRGHYTLIAFTELLIRMLLDGISTSGSALKTT